MKEGKLMSYSQHQLISIIVPIYNVEDYLKRCIDSILGQTYKNLEVILVDDGSPDKCGKIIDSRIKVIHKKNGGLSSARNNGLDIATGDFIGFVDSDDYIERNMYESLIEALNNNNADIATCGIIREDTNTQHKINIRTPNTEKVYLDIDAIREILLSREIGISVWSKLYKREIFSTLRFPVGENNEDAAIVLECISGRVVVHTGICTYHYIVRNNSITKKYSIANTFNFWKHSQSIVNEINDNFSLLQTEARYYSVFGLFGMMIDYKSQSKISDPNYEVYYKVFLENYEFLKDHSSFKTKMKITILRYCPWILRWIR